MADMLLHTLIALLVAIVAARLVGLLFRAMKQPPVIGEIAAGIMLGPSLLGRVAPDASRFLLPPEIAPVVGVIAQIGVVLYMFIVGLKLDTKQLRERTRVAIAVSNASIVAPFLLGALLALWLYPRFSTGDVPFKVFALFMGISMSITAFPVLARILTDRGMHTTPLGAMALTCAAVDDVTAWCLLAFLMSVVRAAPGDSLITIGFTAAFILTMILAVGPAISFVTRWRDQRDSLTQGMFSIVCVALLVSALAAESIGIHALFGAFLLGALIPHDSALADDVAKRLEDVAVVLLLPVFFAYTGMRTQIGLVTGSEELIACALIIVVASLGKFGGSTLVARVTGLGWRESVALGVLMNTRGLMELVVLNIGLDLKLVSPTLFAMLVTMALVTTLATTPILHLLRLEAPRC
jgi:Kef-type K+ transport system membrane component KefB